VGGFFWAGGKKPPNPFLADGFGDAFRAPDSLNDRAVRQCPRFAGRRIEYRYGPARALFSVRAEACFQLRNFRSCLHLFSLRTDCFVADSQPVRNLPIRLLRRFRQLIPDQFPPPFRRKVTPRQIQLSGVGALFRPRRGMFSTGQSDRLISMIRAESAV
jgi:hypothetical protein